MRLSAWAVLGGSLVVLGFGYIAYLAFAVYPRFASCPYGVFCSSIVPLWDNPALWTALGVAVVGTSILAITYVRLRSVRRRIRRLPEAQTETHSGTSAEVSTTIVVNTQRRYLTYPRRLPTVPNR